MEVYLLRHGETEGNVNRTYSGWTDTPLTETGKKQAVDAHLRFEDVKFDVVLSSPLSRALDTARVFTDQHIIVDDDLKEMHFGKLEGLSYQEILEQYPEEAEKWEVEGSEYFFPEGESLRSFYDRIVSKYDKLLKEYKVDKLLIVAHSGVIKSILAKEIAESFDQYWKFYVDNCKVSVLKYDRGNCYLKAFNV